MTETSRKQVRVRRRHHWRGWQDSWDRQQEWYMPDREERFRVMLDMVEACVGPAPRVLDLACGTGSITDRLLKRFPQAVSTGVDLDPALLAIAERHLRRGRARHLRERRPQGPGVGPGAAVRLLRRRPHRDRPALAAQRAARRALRAGRRARPGRRRLHERRPHDRPRHARASTRPNAPTGTPRWTAPRPPAPWTGPSGGRWPPRTPYSPEPTAQRYEIYGEHADGDMPSAAWHAETLRAAGLRRGPPGMGLALGHAAPRPQVVERHGAHGRGV